MKFYEVTNANRTISNQGLLFQFVCYDMGSTWHGVLATDKPDEIKALDELVEKKKVYAITEAEYANCIKTKKAAASGYAQSLAVFTPTPGEVVPATPTAIDTLPNPNSTEPPPAPLESVDAAIEVVSVQRKVKK